MTCLTSPTSLDAQGSESDWSKNFNYTLIGPELLTISPLWITHFIVGFDWSYSSIFQLTYLLFHDSQIRSGHEDFFILKGELQRYLSENLSVLTFIDIFNAIASLWNCEQSVEGAWSGRWCNIFHLFFSITRRNWDWQKTQYSYSGHNHDHFQ